MGGSECLPALRRQGAASWALGSGWGVSLPAAGLDRRRCREEELSGGRGGPSWGEQGPHPGVFSLHHCRGLPPGRWFPPPALEGHDLGHGWLLRAQLLCGSGHRLEWGDGASICCCDCSVLSGRAWQDFGDLEALKEAGPLYPWDAVFQVKGTNSSPKGPETSHGRRRECKCLGAPHRG